ncbi:translation machinery-associated protein 16 [Nothophoma quercina]|uniref:Translation machinery-associated protein 16 n=1 Tax=Nothophoma quercina TaxID=749835 RepID=A0ABR3QWA4_9PLEO
MVSDRLSKVHKAIAKKKGKNPNLHEGSRDTKRLQRASARDDKLNRLSKLREKENRHYCGIKDLQAMIEDYLGRDDEELAKLKAERRAGRPPSTRQTLLEQARATEQDEYASGFWVPDLEDEQVLEKLKQWDGKWASLPTLKFARISKEGHKKVSSFPPKGMS